MTSAELYSLICSPFMAFSYIWEAKLGQSHSAVAVIASIISIYRATMSFLNSGKLATKMLFLCGWIPIGHGLSVGLGGISTSIALGIIGHTGVSVSSPTPLPNAINRKKALLIGINYKGTKMATAACVEDAFKLKQFLSTSIGFSTDPKDMVCLVDNSPDPKFQPTRMNIVNAMKWLVSDAKEGDSLFLFYAGHCMSISDIDGDEMDGKDEIILPVDYIKDDIILDDEMHDILIKPLLPGVRLTVLFDTCCSGTALDLPYIYDENGNVKKRNETDPAKNKINGFVGDLTVEKKKSSSAEVIMLSACQDSQLSWTPVIKGEYIGALTYSFMKALTENPKQSFLELMTYIIALHKKNRYFQVPQISSSHPMQLDKKFLL